VGHWPGGRLHRKNGKVLWGAFNQNVFSFAGDDDMPDVNVSILQPILSDRPWQWLVHGSVGNVDHL
jgi:hypothetical protein